MTVAATPAPQTPQTPQTPAAAAGAQQQPNPLRDALSGVISDMQQIHAANPQLATQMAAAMQQLTSSAAAHAGAPQQPTT